MDGSEILMEVIPSGQSRLKQELNRVHLWIHIREQNQNEKRINRSNMPEHVRRWVDQSRLTERNASIDKSDSDCGGEYPHKYS